MRNSVKFLFFSLAFLLIFSGCYLYQTSGKSATNFASAYKKDATVMHPQFVILHKSDSISQLYFSINAKELLYTKQPEESSFSAQVRISYRLLLSYESQQVVDSSSLTLMNENNSFSNKIKGMLPFNARYGNDYLLEIVLTDLKRDQSIKQYLNVDKKNNWNRQNFMEKEENTLLSFKDYFSPDEKIIINYKYPVKSLHVSYYQRKFPIATPPFAQSENNPFEYKPDSTFIISPKDSTSFVIQLLKEGLYHFRTDISQNDGLTLFSYGKDFPEIHEAQDLVPPMRYITTNEEFDEINIEKSKKTAVDNLWLNIAGSRERAKELIRKFYSRVQNANDFFSSYIEGWQTDRGMIYIIYGPPNSIYRTSFSEKWIYGEENNMMSLTFNFNKVANPFTDNDYALERSPLFKTSWYKAVDAWRQGRVY